jgi:HK97 gp10 family phage protein
LRDSIHQEIEGPYVGSLIASTEYADYVEYGTSKMEAQPYMEPAAVEIDTQIEDIANEEIGSPE